MRNLDMTPYTDSYGLITTSQLDGGDSSHKTAHKAIAELIGPSPEIGPELNKMRFFFLAMGLVRHPDVSKWYSNPQTYSRDQFAPQVIFSALVKDSWLKIFFRKHLSRLLLFAWNTRPSWNEGTYWKMPDITSPFEFWGFYIRGFRCWLLYPWLILADIETVISAIIKRFDSDFDINNCLAAILLAKNVMPTGLGHLAYWIIKPVLKKKLQAYWAEDRYEPPIGDLYIKALDLE